MVYISDLDIYKKILREKLKIHFDFNFSILYHSKVGTQYLVLECQD